MPAKNWIPACAGMTTGGEERAMPAKIDCLKTGNPV